MWWTLWVLIIKTYKNERINCKRSQYKFQTWELRSVWWKMQKRILMRISWMEVASISCWQLNLTIWTFRRLDLKSFWMKLLRNQWWLFLKKEQVILWPFKHQDFNRKRRNSKEFTETRLCLIFEKDSRETLLMWRSLLIKSWFLNMRKQRLYLQKHKDH